MNGRCQTHWAIRTPFAMDADDPEVELWRRLVEKMGERHNESVTAPLEDGWVLGPARIVPDVGKTGRAAEWWSDILDGCGCETQKATL